MEVVLEVWAAAEAEEEEEDDDDLCTICYVYTLNATFNPCEHQSCTACIKRHLLNSKKCFFCNTEIVNVAYGGAADDADAAAAAGVEGEQGVEGGGVSSCDGGAAADGADADGADATNAAADGDAAGDAE